MTNCRFCRELGIEPNFTKSKANKPNPPSIEPSPSLELKASPKCLKDIYLDGQETLPVIITSHLTVGQEESPISVLRKHREAIGKTMTDIKKLSPAIIQHHIHLNEKVKPKRDPQSRLNSIVQEVVRTEIMKI